MDLFSAIARKMAWLGQRQSVLAQNIANADTPEYRPMDLAEGAFARTLRSTMKPVQPSATHTAHLKGIPNGQGANKSDEQRQTYEVAPAGNSVVLEEQLIKVGQTQMDYQMLSNLYRKHAAMMRAALGRNS